LEEAEVLNWIDHRREQANSIRKLRMGLVLAVKAEFALAGYDSKFQGPG
jgi:hypothetical protein